MNLYFAYGSNLNETRFNSRIKARFQSCASLPGYRLVFHKRSSDGSGKATIVPDGNSTVEGALFTYADKDHEILKRIEVGYSVLPVPVVANGRKVDALTFVADMLDPTLLPYDWYLELIIAGGQKLGLPESYLSQLHAVKTMTDMDTERAARERAFLA